MIRNSEFSLRNRHRAVSRSDALAGSVPYRQKSSADLNPMSALARAPMNFNNAKRNEGPQGRSAGPALRPPPTPNSRSASASRYGSRRMLPNPCCPLPSADRFPRGFRGCRRHHPLRPLHRHIPPAPAPKVILRRAGRMRPAIGPRRVVSYDGWPMLSRQEST